MQRHLLTIAIALLASTAGFSQTDEWWRQMNEGASAENLGNYAQAAASYRLATEIGERLERSDRRRALAWNSMATMYDAMGRFSQAESAYRRALREAAESTGKAGSEYALVLSNLGSILVEGGQTPAGERMLREALAIYSAADPPDELRIAVARNALAEVLCAGRKYKEAGPLLASALAVLEKKPAVWRETALARNNLGVVRFMEGNQLEGRRLLLASLAMMEQKLGPDHPMLVRALSNVATVEYRSGNREGAGPWLRRALKIAETRLGTEHPAYGMILANYAAFLRERGEKSQAKTLEAQSRQILKDSSRRNGLGAVIDVQSLRSR